MVPCHPQLGIASTSLFSATVCMLSQCFSGCERSVKKHCFESLCKCKKSIREIPVTVNLSPVVQHRTFNEKQKQPSSVTSSNDEQGFWGSFTPSLRPVTLCLETLPPLPLFQYHQHLPTGLAGAFYLLKFHHNAVQMV